MADLILILALFALIALARAYVWACERLASGREDAARGSQARERGTAALAPLPLVASIGLADGAGLAIAIGLLAYLFVTLLAPERFR